MKSEFKSKKDLQVFTNSREKTDFSAIQFADLALNKCNFTYNFKDGTAKLDEVFNENLSLTNPQNEQEISILHNANLVEFCTPNIILNAMAFFDYYKFDNLKRLQPKLNSVKEFINSSDYLSQFKIDVHLGAKTKDNLQLADKMAVAKKFLQVLEQELRQNNHQYQGSKIFTGKIFNQVFYDKEIFSESKFAESMQNNAWYIFEDFYGTQEEKTFIDLFKKLVDDISKSHETQKIYLARNEKHVGIYAFADGKRFEPDFLLFIQNGKETKNYQIFIEPKGEHLMLVDKWKEDFLKQIADNHKIAMQENSKYKLIGLEFYNKNKESDFEKDLYEKLSMQN